jgi:flavin-dependent dehydrogenase
MAPPPFDVIVIGGGPAGSAAATYTARAGYSVCLVERQSFPRETLCGEFLSHEVLAVLRDLGLDQKFLSLSPSPINQFTLLPDRGARLSEPLGFAAYGMKRSTFDLMLLDCARSHGVSIIQPADVESVDRMGGSLRVLCRTSGGHHTVRARWAIGAYGRSSPLDRELKRPFAGSRSGLNGIKFHVPASTLANVRADEIIICAGAGMYCGINHVDGGAATICFLEQRTEGNRSPRERILDLVEGNPGFAGIISPEALLAIQQGAIYGTGNIYFGPRSLVEDGVLMVGDAARVIAPLAGDGISMALQGAQLLGRVFEHERRASEGRDALARSYQREWERLFKTRVRTAFVLQHVLLSTPLRRFTSSLPGSTPFLLRTALRLTRGASVARA